MMASQACSGALQLRPGSDSTSLLTIPLCGARGLKSSSVSFNSGHGLKSRHSSSGARRSAWRPVFSRSEIKPTSSPTQEPVKPVSVVDKDGKVGGVIQVEREDNLPQPTWGRIYTLAAGDVAFLLLFATIGRLSHGFAVVDWDTVRAADPFLAGWFVGSYFTGGYGPEGQGLKGLKSASAVAFKSWVVALPIALAIRGFTIGHVPPTPFIVVSLASTFVLQVGWRTAFTAVFPNDEKAFQTKKDNRKGTAFEFFELLTSLVKRW